MSEKNVHTFLKKDGAHFYTEIITLKQCCGSVTFWSGSGCGSGSSDPYLGLTDPDADPGGPKTYGSGSGCVSGPLIKIHIEITKQ
jgi:hypothetical protein